MSATIDAGRSVAGCRPTDGTPVTIPVEAIVSTAEPDLRAFKAELEAEGLVPHELVIDVDFSTDCSLTTQAEADRIRRYLAAADYLGAGSVRLEIDTIADTTKVRPALAALRERAEREGLVLVVDGANPLEA